VYDAGMNLMYIGITVIYFVLSMSVDQCTAVVVYKCENTGIKRCSWSQVLTELVK
jgi:hypothetical protein